MQKLPVFSLARILHLHCLRVEDSRPAGRRQDRTACDLVTYQWYILALAVALVAVGWVVARVRGSSRRAKIIPAVSTALMMAAILMPVHEEDSTRYWLKILRRSAMTANKLLAIGVIGTIVTAICYFTPMLVIVLGAV